MNDLPISDSVNYSELDIASQSKTPLSGKWKIFFGLMFLLALIGFSMGVYSVVKINSMHEVPIEIIDFKVTGGLSLKNGDAIPLKIEERDEFKGNNMWLVEGILPDNIVWHYDSYRIDITCKKPYCAIYLRATLDGTTGNSVNYIKYSWFIANTSFGVANKSFGKGGSSQGNNEATAYYYMSKGRSVTFYLGVVEVRGSVTFREDTDAVIMIL